MPAPQESFSPRGWFWVSVAVLALDLFLILTTFRDYGMSCDQFPHHSYGEHVINYLRTGYDPMAVSAFSIYGTTYELAAHFISSFFGSEWMDGRNLTSALFGLLGVYATMRIAAALFGPAVGATAAGFLFLNPIYYGHQFMNPKDLPFAALNVFTLWQIIRLCREYPKIRVSTSVMLTLALGLTLATRIGGVFLFGVLGGGLVAAALSHRQKGSFARLGLLIGGIGVGSWLLIMLIWPFAREHPILGPYDSLLQFSNFTWGPQIKTSWVASPHKTYEPGWIFYHGRYVFYTDLARTYALDLMVRTMPEFILLGWLGWLLAGISKWRALPSQSNSVTSPALENRAGIIALLLAIFLPALTVALLHPILYDGYRHLLFVVPPLVILAAAGAWRGGQALLNRPAKTIWAGAILLSMLVTAADMRSLHPYEYVYFNRLIGGGIETASRSYELEYWCTSDREAALWTRESLPAPQGASIPYFCNINPYLMAYYLQDTPASRVHFHPSTYAEAKVLFLMRRGREQLAPESPGRLVYTVSRQGVSFLDVIMKEPESEPAELKKPPR